MKLKNNTHLEGETLKRFVINGVLYYFLHSFKPKRRVCRYWFAYVNPEKPNNTHTFQVNARELSQWLKDEGVSLHDAQQIRYDITGKFGK